MLNQYDKGKTMIRIAIVEDEKEPLSILQAHIARYIEETKEECLVTTFPDGLEFLNGYKPVYDVIFMDIEMPHLNGIDTAYRLRDIDTVVNLVFITNLKQYALQGYKVNAVDFLVKPVPYSSFSTMLSRVRKRIKSDVAQELVLHTGKGLYRVPINDIYYIEIVQHNIVYHTANGDYSFWGAISDEEKKLPKDSFARCNNCYLVNLAYVKRVEGNDVYVKDEVLNISRNRKKDFVQQLTAYLNSRG